MTKKVAAVSATGSVTLKTLGACDCVCGSAPVAASAK